MGKNVLRVLSGFVVLAALLIVGCGTPKEQTDLLTKAKLKVSECESLGERPFARQGRCLVWDLKRNGFHRSHGLLDGSLRDNDGKGPVTVFLVTAKQSQQVGTYSVSRQPAYREWVKVHVVRMPEEKPMGTHEVVSLDPRQRRPVQHNPEYGDPAPPVADWIRSLPGGD